MENPNIPGESEKPQMTQEFHQPEVEVQQNEIAARRKEAMVQLADTEVQQTETTAKETEQQPRTTISDREGSEQEEHKQFGRKFDPTSELPVYNHEKYKIWDKITVHTAKCDRDDCRSRKNQGVLQRCKGRNFQLCRPCFPKHVTREDSCVYEYIDPETLDWTPEASQGLNRLEGKATPKSGTPRRARGQPISGGQNPSKVARSTPTRTPRYDSTHFPRLAPVWKEDRENGEDIRKVDRSTPTQLPSHYREHYPQLVPGYEYDYKDWDPYGRSPQYSRVQEQYSYRNDDSGHADRMYIEDDSPLYEARHPAPVRERVFRISKKPGTSIREQHPAERVRHNFGDHYGPPPHYAYGSRSQHPMNNPYHLNAGTRQSYGNYQEYNGQYQVGNRRVYHEGTPFAYAPQEYVHPASQHYPCVVKGTYDVDRLHPAYASRINDGFSGERDLLRSGSAISAEIYAPAAKYGTSPNDSNKKPSRVRHKLSFDLGDDEKDARHLDPSQDDLAPTSMPATKVLFPELAEIEKLRAKLPDSEDLIALLEQGELAAAKDNIQAALILYNEVNGVRA